MARTNKYTSLNFNDIYEKKITPTPTSSLSSRTPSSSSIHHPNKSYSSASSHGGMLLLSRPSPKPSPSPSPTPSSLTTPPSTPPTKSAPSIDSQSISLRPQGTTGPIQVQEREPKETSPTAVIPNPKTDKFVPPHLRPGFVARDQKPPEFQRSSGARPANYRPRSGHGYRGSSPNRYAEDGRPMSGGGYDRRMRGVGGCESDLVDFNRPPSGGGRPSSSG